MILALLLAATAFAGDLNRECSVNNPGLQRFFSEYVEAHSKADTKGLKKMVTEDFWETYSEYAPKKPGKRFKFNLLSTLVKGDYCHVEWAITEAGKKQEAPAWFRLELKDKWKLDGIAAELED
jgi:hypothetical protein